MEKTVSPQNYTRTKYLAKLSKMQNLENFLKQYKYDKTLVDGPKCTNTKFKTDFGGSWSIPHEKYEQFLELYYNAVFTSGKFNGAKVHYTEYQADCVNRVGFPLCFDIDLKFPSSITERSMGRTHIEAVLNTIIDVLKQNHTCETPMLYKIYVMQRRAMSNCGDESKDGLHIIVDFKISGDLYTKVTQRFIRSKLLTCGAFDDLEGQLNSAELIYDNHLVKNSAPWPVYGSCKPGKEPYEISHIYTFGYNEELKEIEFDGNCSLEMFKNLSVRYGKKCEYSEAHFINDDSELWDERKRFIAEEEKKAQGNNFKQADENILELSERTPFNMETPFEELPTDVQELCEMATILNVEKYITPHQEWIKLLMALRAGEKNPDDHMVPFGVLTRRSPKYYVDYYWINQWNQINASAVSKLSMGTFFYSARESDPVKYAEIRAFYKEKRRSEVINLDTYCSDPSDANLAELFTKLYGEDFLYFNAKRQFQYNGIYWKLDTERMNIKNHIQTVFRKRLSEYLRTITTEKCALYDTPVDELDETEKKELTDRQKAYSKRCGQCEKTIHKMSDNKHIKNIAESVERLLKPQSDGVTMDAKSYLFAFKNKVYDLNAHDFVLPRRDDYISITTGYDHREATDAEVDALDRVIDQIFPDADDQRLYMVILSTGMYGLTIEKFFLANGCGRNGKGLINTLAMDTVGNYGYNANASALVDIVQSGKANPDLANMRHKRLIVFSEPPENGHSKCTLRTSEVKNVTGGSKIAARFMFDNDTNTILCGTCILECNTRPNMGRPDEPVDDAVTKRFVDILFQSRFTERPEELDASNHIYPLDQKLKEVEFTERAKFALFKRLQAAWKDFDDNDRSIDKFVPLHVQQRSLQYLTGSNAMLAWFEQNYKLYVHAAPREQLPSSRVALPKSKWGDQQPVSFFVQLKTLFEEFKGSEEYARMNTKQQKECTYNSFCEVFGKSPLHNKFLVARHKYKKNNKLKEAQNAMVGYLSHRKIAFAFNKVFQEDSENAEQTSQISITDVNANLLTQLLLDVPEHDTEDGKPHFSSDQILTMLDRLGKHITAKDDGQFMEGYHINI